MPTRARLGTAFAATCVALAVPMLGACAGNTGTVATKTVTATAAPTTTSTTSQRDALAAWHDATLVPAQEVHDGLSKISTAADAGDLTTMGIACQEVHDAVAEFQQHLPSPDPELNAQLQKALSDYNAAASICTTAVENHNIDDFQQGATLVSEGDTYMGNVLKILERDLGESSNSPAPPSPSSPSIAAKAEDPEAASLQQLQQLASSDSPFVKAELANWWVPQLSSKRPGVVDDGVVWDNVRTLQEHLQLRQQYPRVRLLWSGDWSTFSAPDFWVTVAGVTFPESSGALTWCSNQGLDSDHCAAKIVSTTHPIEGSTAYS
ncbi:hypothetical protein [Mycobacterium malmoense]|nr:hypothetical protein [Mycobacterium malmoense]